MDWSGKRRIEKRWVSGWVLALSMVVPITGCQSPFLLFPGGPLEGEFGTTSSFAFAEKHQLLQLETGGERPYSVYLRVTVIEGELYLDAAPTRRWGRNLRENSRVKIKLGDMLYRARVERVLEAGITSRFLPRRMVYRVVPLGN